MFNGLKGLTYAANVADRLNNRIARISFISGAHSVWHYCVAHYAESGGGVLLSAFLGHVGVVGRHMALDVMLIGIRDKSKRGVWMPYVRK